MKREDVLKFLTAIFSTILIHDALISELSAIIERSGFEKKFFKMLMARLRYLEEFGASAINYREGFESLAHQADGLYSMRLKGSGFNIRILYAFVPDGAPILLVGFGERSGKRVSSYESYIPVAKERLKHILEA